MASPNMQWTGCPGKFEGGAGLPAVLCRWQTVIGIALTFTFPFAAWPRSPVGLNERQFCHSSWLNRRIESPPLLGGKQLPGPSARTSCDDFLKAQAPAALSAPGVSHYRIPDARK